MALTCPHRIQRNPSLLSSIVGLSKVQPVPKFVKHWVKKGSTNAGDISSEIERSKEKLYMNLKLLKNHLMIICHTI